MVDFRIPLLKQRKPFFEVKRPKNKAFVRKIEFEYRGKGFHTFPYFPTIKAFLVFAIRCI